MHNPGQNKDILFLFDVDGTLSPSRESAPPEIIEMLHDLRQKALIGFVGGSDLAKQVEQIGDNILDLFDYGFPENGAQFYKDGKLVKGVSIIDFLSQTPGAVATKQIGFVNPDIRDAPVLQSTEEDICCKKSIGESCYSEIVSIIHNLFSKITLPVKRGNFVELRNSMINISPIGRTCTREERVAFYELDKKIKLREFCCDYLNEKLSKYRLTCVVGGQISIDIFPIGWDKTFCLQYVEASEILFFGDMTMKGGNDNHIYEHERVKGHTVNGPADTIKQVKKELERLGIN